MCSVQAFAEEVQILFPGEIRQNPQAVNLLALERWSLFQLSPQVHDVGFVPPRRPVRYRECPQNVDDPFPVLYTQTFPRSILNIKEIILDHFQGEQFNTPPKLFLGSTRKTPLVKDFHERIGWYLHFSPQMDHELASERKGEIWQVLERHEEAGNWLQFQNASWCRWEFVVNQGFLWVREVRIFGEKW